jgi:hypothetical protein
MCDKNSLDLCVPVVADIPCFSCVGVLLLTSLLLLCQCCWQHHCLAGTVGGVSTVACIPAVMSILLLLVSLLFLVFLLLLASLLFLISLMLLQCNAVTNNHHSKKITEPMLSNWILHQWHFHWGNTCLFLPPTTCFTVTVNEIKDTQFVLLI